MKKKLLAIVPSLVLIGGVQLAFSPTASAHNRGQVELPNGGCIVVGSLKSVVLPDGSNLDLRPETPQDEIGAAFAAGQGKSKLEIGDCT